MDSNVVETNVHFPTDINLTWDCSRKCLNLIGHLKKTQQLSGWRESRSLFKKVRSSYRKTSEIHRKKGFNYRKRLQSATTQYLSLGHLVRKKIAITLATTQPCSKKERAYLEQLSHYYHLLNKHLDLVDRRIIKGEVIPHHEKIFSIFEPHTKWIRKGKLDRQVELGVNFAVATDQYQFVVGNWIMEEEVDKQMSIQIGHHVYNSYGLQSYDFCSISFDRNYFSSLAQQSLSRIYNVVVLPKPGKKSQKQKEIESEPMFVELRKAHSTVEANIAHMDHHGLKRCPDKGIKNFRKYTKLGALSHNLQLLGNILIQLKKLEVKRRRKAA